MIKTLLNADEEPPPKTTVVIEDTVINPPPETQNAEIPAVEEKPEITETRQVFEIPEEAKFFAKPPETIDETAHAGGIFEPNPEPLIEPVSENSTDLKTFAAEPENPSFDAPMSNENAPIDTLPSAENAKNESSENAKNEQELTIFRSEYKPETAGETIRQTGLAWSAGIVFFGSIVFMMIFGWFADLLLGSSPWGLVGGIILGAIIGFVQFFRITSQIFKK